MFRPLLAAALGFLCLLPEAAAQAPVASRSTVFFAHDDQAMEQEEENARRTGRMVDALVLAVTGKTELSSAWRSLVKPEDRVGIKVATAGGRKFSSHRGIVAAVLAGLESAGLPRSRVIIWDRQTEQLRAAGFTSATTGAQVRGIDPPRGFDRQATLSAPLLGTLMWGDLLFEESQRRAFGKPKKESDQLSSTSHLASLLSREVNRIINIPVLADDRGCGVAGAIYNVTVPNVDNWRRFTQTHGPISSSPAELYADERIGPKVVLHILDGLLAQYAGGQTFSPNYAFAHHTIYASKDPVALDSVALRQLEVWRQQAKLPSIGSRGAWLEVAAQMGLGNCKEEAITLTQVQAAR
ncbi:MAG TPA: DUF362 domain-containing protein [Chthoniobacteraceae bacterium]